ncbi:MAG: hypothetical protein ACFB0B_21850 [Thermonemataceae bacterium]
MKVNTIILIVYFLSFTQLQAQNDPFIGTFVNTSGSTTMRLKKVANEYHGLFQFSGSNFALRAVRSGNQLNGEVYAGIGKIVFVDTPLQGGFRISANGEQSDFILYSTDHEIQSMDLTASFPQTSNNTPQTQNPSTQPSQPQPKSNVTDNSVPKSNNAAFKQVVAGSQMMVYSKSPRYSSRKSRSSTLIFIHFCPNGRFHLTYDASYAVSTDDIGSYGVNKAAHQGTWYIGKKDGYDVVGVNFDNGNKSFYWLTPARAQQKSFRLGNTKYTFMPGKAVCK